MFRKFELMYPEGEESSGGEGSFESEGSQEEGEADTFENLDMEEYEDGDDDDSSNFKKTDKKSRNEKKMSESADNNKEKGKKDNKSSIRDNEDSEDNEDNEGSESDDEIEFLKAKYSDTDYEIHPDAEFQVDEDGDPISLSEIIDGYKNFRENDEKFNSFDDEKENFYNEKRTYQDKIDNAEMITRQYNYLKELAKENPTDSFFEVLDLLNVNSHNGFKALTDTLFPNLKRAVNELDGAEFDNYLLHLENQFIHKFNDISNNRMQREKEEYRLQNEINTYKRRYGLSDGALKDSYREMLKLQENGAKFNNGISPETISKYALQKYVDKQAPALLEKIQKGLSSDQEILKKTVSIMDELRSEMDRDFSEDELVDIASEIVDAFKIDLDKKDNRKSSKKKKGNRKKVVTNKKNEVPDDDTFDNFDDYFY